MEKYFSVLKACFQLSMQVKNNLGTCSGMNYGQKARVFRRGEPGRCSAHLLLLEEVMGPLLKVDGNQELF